PCRFVSQDVVDVLAVRPGRGLSLRLRWRQRLVRADYEELYESLRGEARGFRQALHRAARQRAVGPARHDEEEADAGRLLDGAANLRSDPPVRLRDALRRRRGVPGLL